ncbi:MAG: hypothetical protein H6Q25_1062 [Bacteroidetes bacterium]|nr:hypothetical protein [Bacteroidota bacterium]
MKSITNKIAGFFSITLIMIVLLSSCTDDNSNNNINDVVKQGEWKVSSFMEDGSDHTSYFSGYQFTFAESGVLTATNGSSTQTGTWVKGTDDSTPKLIITFAVSDGPFEEISEDWEILSYTDTKIELKHVSGGDGSIDYLTFIKN